MFGLLSDLLEDKWVQKGDPPADKTTMAGYQPYGIQKAVPGQDFHITYYCTSGAGVPHQAELHGVERNLLRDVGHCWMKLIPRKAGHIVAGIALEDDWVEMNPEYLETFPEKTKEDEEKESKAEENAAFEMGLISDLNCGKWNKKKDAIPRQKSKLGYKPYSIVRVGDGNKNEYHCYLQNDTGTELTATLKEAARNPFHSILNAYMKIEKVGSESVIKGIMVEDEWVEMA